MPSLRDAAFFLAFISPFVKDDLHIAEHTYIVYYSFTYFIGILYPLFLCPSYVGFTEHVLANTTYIFYSSSSFKYIHS